MIEKFKSKKNIICIFIVMIVVMLNIEIVFATGENSATNAVSEQDKNSINNSSINKTNISNDTITNTQTEKINETKSESKTENKTKIETEIETKKTIEDGTYVIRSSINQKFVLDVLRSIEK